MEALRQGGKTLNALGPSKKAGVAVMTKYRPGKRPWYRSSMNFRKASRPLSRVSERMR